MKKSTFLRASLAALLLGGTGSLGTQAQGLPTLSTDNEPHYYLIQNNRSGKFADKDFNQTTTVSTATVWTLTASDETLDGGLTAKIHNMGVEDASANALNGFDHTYTADGITWYIQAESGGAFSISSSTAGLDTEGSGDGSSWNDAGGFGQTISTWNHSDAGSQWNIVDIDGLKAQAQGYIDAVSGHNGESFYPTTEAVNSLQAAIDAVNASATLDEFVTESSKLATAISTFKSSSLALPEAGTYYIVNHKYSYYMTVASEGAGVTASEEKTNNAIWTLTYNDDNTFTLVNPFGYYIGAIPGSASAQYTSTTDASAAGSFSFVAAGTTYPGYTAIGGTANQRQMHEDASHKVVNWGTGAEATFWTLEAATIPYDGIIADYIKEVEAHASYVGGVDIADENYATAKATALATPNKATYDALVAAANSADKVALDPAKFYRIQNYARKNDAGNSTYPGKGGCMEVVDRNISSPVAIDLSAIERDNSHTTALWQFVPNDGESTYKLHNLNSDSYISTTEKTNGSNHTYAAVVDADNAAAITLTDLGNAQWNIIPGSNNALHVSGGTEDAPGRVIYYNGGANTASAWYIIEATTIDLNVGSTGYASVNYPFAVELPSGVTAYKVENETDAAVTLTELTLTDNVLPANTPVIVTVAAAGTYTLTLLPDNTDAAIETGLKGTTMSVSAAAYILGKKDTDTEVKFYTLADGSYVYPNKAYLDATSATAESLALKIGGTTTGITGATATDGAETYYDLNGRRVLYPAKGIFVTESGKKVILK